MKISEVYLENCVIYDIELCTCTRCNCADAELLGVC